jgi:heme exporter protein C
VKKLFTPLAVVAALMFACAPVMIARAPSEATMGLVFKIFFFHVPAGMIMFASAFVCGISSALYLWRHRAIADHVAVAAGELTALFGVIVLVTGPLWARKSWGVWWQWDARLTMSLLLWLMFVGYLLVRKYGGPGSDKLGAAMAIFGMANVPFVYVSVNIWRTLHPKTSVVPTLGPGMSGPFLFSALAFLILYGLLLAMRVRLERQRAQIDKLYLLEGER